MGCRVLVQGSIFGRQEHGGVSRYSAELLNRVGRCCPDVKPTVLLPTVCRSTALDMSSVDCIRGYDEQRGAVSKVCAIVQALARRPNVFHATYYAAPRWYHGRRVATVYDFIHEEHASFYDHDEVRFMAERTRQVIMGATIVMAISESVREKILHYVHVDPDRVRVIYPGVSEVFLRTQPSAEELSRFRRKHQLDSSYWLYVGTRSRYKNFGAVLDAFLSLPSRGNHMLVAVGGAGQLEPCQVDRLAREQMEGRVCLLPLADEELRLAYAGALGLVVTSLAEGFGIPLLEAMACGAPVLASDIPVFHETAGDLAWYFDPRDPGKLTDLFQMTATVSRDESRLIKAAERARQFSWDKSARLLGQVYRDAME